MFPQIFAGEGATFDLILKNAAGASVRTYDDVPSLGPEANTLIRDFLTGGRFQVTGNAGTIRVAFGSASPDDTGGAAELTGWAGTQLETLRLHADVTTVSGALRTEGQSYLALEDRLTVEGGKELGDIVLASGSFSAAATVDIALSADYDVVEIEVIDITGAVSQILARVSFDTGATFKSGAGDYSYIQNRFTGSAVSHAEATAGGAGTEFLVAYHNAVAGHRSAISLTTITSSTASMATTLISQGVSNSDMLLASGHTKETYGRATHVRLYPNTATISGRYRVVGKKGW